MIYSDFNLWHVKVGHRASKYDKTMVVLQSSTKHRNLVLYILVIDIEFREYK